MDDIFRLLLFFHLMAMAMAISIYLVVPVVSRNATGLPADAHPIMASLITRLNLGGPISLLVLLATGGAMVGLRYGDSLWSYPWFVAKMGFVGLVILSLAASFLQRFHNIPLRIIGLTSRVALSGVVFCAVMTFN